MARLKPLPDCEGPKLEAFADDFMSLDIEFLDMQAGGDCLHSHVFKTRIDGKIYCLKVFTLEDSLMLEGPGLTHTAHWKALPEDVQDLIKLHTIPFYNECRAFGRLKELGREDLAVKVHGYVELYANEKYYDLAMASHVKKLGEEERRYFKPYEWVGRGPEDERPRTEPLMAIVKEWIDDPNNSPTDEERELALRNEQRRIPGMLRDLHELHKFGIVNRDLNIGQYVNGILCDFSSAWTMPHILGPEGNIMPSWAFPSMAAWDLWRFQEDVIGHWNEKAAYLNKCEKRKAADRLPLCRIRAYPTFPRRRLAPKPAPNRLHNRLRPLAHRQGPFLPLLDGDHDWREYAFIEWPRHDPSRFDWKNACHVDGKAEKKGRGTKGKGEKQGEGGKNLDEAGEVTRSLSRIRGRSRQLF